MSKEFSVNIPFLPPGINATYGYGKSRVYLLPDAERWSEKAALIIGAKAGQLDWQHQKGSEYILTIIFDNWRMDVDAPIKLVQDTLSRKLGFNDKHVVELHVYKMKEGYKEVIIRLNSKSASG